MFDRSIGSFGTGLSLTGTWIRYQGHSVRLQYSQLIGSLEPLILLM